MRKAVYCFVYYFLYIFVYFWLSLIIFPVKMLSKKGKFQRGSIFVCNHLSFMDVMYMYFFYPVRPMILAKKELEKSAVGPLLKSFNAFSINRGESDIKGLRKILGGLKKGERLLLFPEGTRHSDDGEMGELKSGAALFAIRAQAPITPFIVHHRAKSFRRNYMLRGETFDLSQFYDVKPTPEVLAEASQIITEKMAETRERLNNLVKIRCGKRKWYKQLMLSRETEHPQPAAAQETE